MIIPILVRLYLYLHWDGPLVAARKNQILIDVDEKTMIVMKFYCRIPLAQLDNLPSGVVAAGHDISEEPLYMVSSRFDGDV